MFIELYDYLNDKKVTLSINYISKIEPSPRLTNGTDITMMDRTGTITVRESYAEITQKISNMKERG